MSFGEVMRRLMAERGIALRAPARQVPCDAGYLSKVSHDLKPPSEHVAARLDDLLGADGELVTVRTRGRGPDEDSEAAAEMATATGTRTVATQQQGRALALLGDREGALRAVGEAEETLARGQGSRGDPDGPYFYGAELLTMQRGLILACLGKHAAAADVIGDGVAALPKVIRDSGWIAWYRAQGARARAAAGDVGAAVSEMLETLPVVEATGAVKARAEILGVWRRMARRWPGRASVVELGEALRHR